MNAIPALPLRRALGAAALFAAAALAGAGEAAAPVSWAEPPHWPVGLAPLDPGAGTGKKAPKARILAWLPEGVEHPRCVLLLTNNSDCKDFGQHPALRAVAQRRAMAIVYIRSYPAGGSGKTGFGPPAEGPDGRQQSLDAVAEATGKPSLRHAPWIVLGKSSVAHFALEAAWRQPQRTIASIIYHGEVPSWPLPEGVAATRETVLHCNLNGETEWGGTWFRHVRPGLLNYRATTGWLPHLAVARGVGHGDYIDAAGQPTFGKPYPGMATCQASWDYLTLFIDKAIGLRLPAEGVPLEAPLALRQVDPASGVLLDPFAIEEIWRQPPFPLERRDGAFVLGDGSDPPVRGYAAIAPLAEAVPEDVPVVPLPLGRSPERWLVTEPWPALMQRDPMQDLGGLEKLRPRPGERIAIDGTELALRALDAKEVGANGGINLKAGWKQGQKPASLVAYTVIEVPEAGHWKVRAPFSLAGRLQLVLNGQPVEHQQVVALAPGRYPLLAVLRLNAAWGTVEPWLDPATPEEVELAKRLGDERSRRLAEIARLATTPRRGDEALVRPWSAVPEAERAGMFWLPDAEMAAAWIAYTSLAVAR